MRKIIFALVLALYSSGLYAQDKSGSLGLGVVVGDVTGPSLKYFFSPDVAFDVGLGFSSEFEAYADIVWHNWTVFPRPEKGLFGLYFGAGPRFKEIDNDNAPKKEDREDEFGIRTIAGINYWVQEIPLEIFLEAGPWFVLTPDTDTEFDFGIGARYYFGASAPLTKK